MSTFVGHLVNDLAIKAIPSSLSGEAQVASSSNDQVKQTLHTVLLSLSPSISPNAVHESLTLLRGTFDLSHVSDKEEEGLKKAVLGRTIVGVYGEALNTFLVEATQADSEAEWWDRIERSRMKLAWYLLQTFPARLLNLFRSIISMLQDQKIPIRFSTFSTAAFRSIFSVSESFRPNALTIALFPHLHNQPHLISLSLSSPRYYTYSNTPVNALQSLIVAINRGFSILSSVVTLPIELTRQECLTKRGELQKLRDERAEVLGTLFEMRSSLASVLGGQFVSQNSSFQINAYLPAVRPLQEKLGATSGVSTPMSALHELAFVVLPAHRRMNESFLKSHRLQRPSRLTLVWPNIILLPPLILYGCKYVYASRASLYDVANDAWETVRDFWDGWLVQPLKDVVKTVRASGEHGVIVQKEAVAADLASLERMVLSLARDKLRYDAGQIAELTVQIRKGDLTSVLEIYEEDIKAPVKSALVGSLIRSMLIQVQKAKVDIDQTLSGIDKLLKSQELTFAFVGVAPALAIVYVVAGYLRRLWSGGRGRGLYGGKNNRTMAWVTMRRIERLLIVQPLDRQTTTTNNNSTISPLTSGLLLLSVTRLRSFAEKHLPLMSHIREGFLQDVKDLEDPDLGRLEKLKVVDRMWRCWGTSLKWTTVER